MPIKKRSAINGSFNQYCSKKNKARPAKIIAAPMMRRMVFTVFGFIITIKDFSIER
jgi:hypothetical protein